MVSTQERLVGQGFVAPRFEPSVTPLKDRIDRGSSLDIHHNGRNDFYDSIRQVRNNAEERLAEQLRKSTESIYSDPQTVSQDKLVVPFGTALKDACLDIAYFTGVTSVVQRVSGMAKSIGGLFGKAKEEPEKKKGWGARLFGNSVARVAAASLVGLMAVNDAGPRVSVGAVNQPSSLTQGQSNPLPEVNYNVDHSILRAQEGEVSAAPAGQQDEYAEVEIPKDGTLSQALNSVGVSAYENTFLEVINDEQNRATLADNANIEAKEAREKLDEAESPSMDQQIIFDRAMAVGHTVTEGQKFRYKLSWKFW